jgi:hypothetical protein
MPYANLEERRQKQKLQKQKKRDCLRSVSPTLYINPHFLEWKPFNKLCVDELNFIEIENIKYHELKNPNPYNRASPHFDITFIHIPSDQQYKIENYKKLISGKYV